MQLVGIGILSALAVSNQPTPISRHRCTAINHVTQLLCNLLVRVPGIWQHMCEISGCSMALLVDKSLLDITSRYWRLGGLTRGRQYVVCPSQMVALGPTQ